MKSELEGILIECLDALESGGAIEQVLSGYPDDALHLRPMLEIALALPTLRMEPSHQAKSRSRTAFLIQAAADLARYGPIGGPRWS